MSKKQSSIEWLVKELNDNIDFIPMRKWDKIRDIVQQAKTMHKEEIAKTWDDSLDNLKARGMNEMRAYTDFDEYYKETFGGQDNE
jgi:hypothetical protein